MGGLTKFYFPGELFTYMGSLRKMCPLPRGSKKGMDGPTLVRKGKSAYTFGKSSTREIKKKPLRA